MSNLFGLARMTVSSSGAGSITLNSAVSGFLDFDTSYNLTLGSSIPIGGISVDYSINDTTASEASFGTYTSSNKVLTRGSSALNQMVSTNGGSPINMSNGAQVFVTPTAVHYNQLTGKNKIINGAMDIDQRNNGAAQTFTAGNAVAYCVDRFYAACSGTNVTGQQTPYSYNGFNYSYVFTGLAANTGVLFGQRIESKNSYDVSLSGGPNVTFSVFLATSAGATITWTAYSANSTDNFSAKTSIATGTFVTTSLMEQYTAVFSALGAGSTGIAIEFTIPLLLALATWQITGLQVEAGSVSTPFEHRQYGTELVLCKRYLPAFYSGGVVSILPFTGTAINTTSCYGVMVVDVKPRVGPTGVTVSNIAYCSVTDQTANTVCTSLGLASSNSGDAIYMVFSAASGLTQYHSYGLFFNNAAGQLFFTGCEL